MHADALGESGWDDAVHGMCRASVSAQARPFPLVRPRAGPAPRQQVNRSCREGLQPRFKRTIHAGCVIVPGARGRAVLTPEQVVRRYYRLFNERQLEEAALLVDPLASFYYVPTKQRLIGRAGYRALASGWLAAFPDARIDIRSVRRVDYETVRLEFVGRGSHRGDLMLGDTLVIPATGRSATLVFRNALKIRASLIRSVRFDLDAQELRRRLTGDG